VGLVVVLREEVRVVGLVAVEPEEAWVVGLVAVEPEEAWVVGLVAVEPEEVWVVGLVAVEPEEAWAASLVVLQPQAGQVRVDFEAQPCHQTHAAKAPSMSNMPQEQLQGEVLTVWPLPCNTCAVASAKLVHVLDVFFPHPR